MIKIIPMKSKKFKLEIFVITTEETLLYFIEDKKIDAYFYKTLKNISLY